MSWPLSQDYNEAIQSPGVNFADADPRHIQFAELAYDIVAIGRLDVNGIDLNVAVELLQIGGEQFGRQVLGRLGKPAEFVRERHVNEDGFQVIARLCRRPYLVGAVGVGREDQRRLPETASAIVTAVTAAGQ